MITPWLGIPRIEDRRYDVVISFHIATPLRYLGMHICASNRGASRRMGNAQVPTSPRLRLDRYLTTICIVRDDVFEFGSRLISSIGSSTPFGLCYLRR